MPVKTAAPGCCVPGQLGRGSCNDGVFKLGDLAAVDPPFVRPFGAGDRGSADPVQLPAWEHPLLGAVRADTHGGLAGHTREDSGRRVRPSPGRYGNKLTEPIGGMMPRC